MKLYIYLYGTVLWVTWAGCAEENNIEAQLAEIINKMNTIHTSTLIKEYNSSNSKATLSLEDVQVKIEESKDACEQTYYWDGWQTQSGGAVRTLFEEYVKLENQVAVKNNFTDYAALWQDTYKTDDFEALMEKQLEDIMPLFKQLHAYLRYQLWLVHGKNNEVIDLEGPIPASLTKSIWGMDAIGAFDETLPYPNIPSIDVSPTLKLKNYTGLKMAKEAEKFYISLGFDPMTETFWKNSIFEKPANIENFDCSDLSENPSEGDYRIRMCATPTQDDWGRVHYQMGHIINYMQWKDLPEVCRNAPNPAFSSLTGDTVYLCVTGPTHLKNVGLLDSSFEIDQKQMINALYYQALSIVFFLPYAYSLDLWRWRVFQGKITPDNYNCEYWKIRTAVQGVEPPVNRDEKDFDPGAKSHVVTDYQYILYFFSGILEFQLHKALCEAAGQYDHKNPNTNPTFMCDFANSKAAGDKLKSMLSLGNSRPWQDALEKSTGTRTLDAGPLLTYFQPLHKWLKAENCKTKQKIGWTTKHTRCYGRGETKPTRGNCRYS